MSFGRILKIFSIAETSRVDLKNRESHGHFEGSSLFEMPGWRLYSRSTVLAQCKDIAEPEETNA